MFRFCSVPLMGDEGMTFPRFCPESCDPLPQQKTLDLLQGTRSERPGFRRRFSNAFSLKHLPHIETIPNLGVVVCPQVPSSGIQPISLVPDSTGQGKQAPEQSRFKGKANRLHLCREALQRMCGPIYSSTRNVAGR